MVMTTREPLGSCHYCDRPDGTTRDHIIPLSRGGVQEDWNIAIACPRCNKAKASDMPTCTCDRCADAVARHWAMIDAIREWSPSWANKLAGRLRVDNPMCPPPMSQTLAEAVDGRR